MKVKLIVIVQSGLIIMCFKEVVRVKGIKVRIIPGEYDPGVLKAKLIADFIENSISHLPVSEQIQIYDQLIDECDEAAKKEIE